MLDPSLVDFVLAINDPLVNTTSNVVTKSSLTMQPPARPRKRKAPTLRESDWAPYKDQVDELYTSGMPLKKVKEIIEVEHGFCAEYVSFGKHSRV